MFLNLKKEGKAGGYRRFQVVSFVRSKGRDDVEWAGLPWRKMPVVGNYQN